MLLSKDHLEENGSVALTGKVPGAKAFYTYFILQAGNRSKKH